jgi:hypothetical protein
MTDGDSDQSSVISYPPAREQVLTPLIGARFLDYPGGWKFFPEK